MIVPLTTQTCPGFARRLKTLAVDATPRFGSLDPPRLMAHLQRAFDISTGAYEAPFVGNRLTKTALMKWFVIDAPLPWPKGRIKAPDSFTPPAATGDYDSERRRLIETMQRFAAEADARPDDPGGQSPLLGALSMRRWAKLHGRHLEHHLQQFRV